MHIRIAMKELFLLVRNIFRYVPTDEYGGSVRKWGNTGTLFGNLLATSFNSVSKFEKNKIYQSILKGKIDVSINIRTIDICLVQNSLFLFYLTANSA